MRFTTAEIAEITGGTAFGEPATIDGVCLDSRLLVPGQLFVPLRDARDGHEFIAGAVERGAGAYLTEHEPVGGSAVRVTDCRVALLALAASARAAFKGDVVGITGSVGKTTTKDLLVAVLAPLGQVHANRASFNNDLGVPHTLLGAPGDTRVLVAEIGTNAPGEIAALSAIAKPTIAVVTRVAPAHTEGFGGIEGVAVEKGALVASLPDSGLAVLNADDWRVLAMRSLTAARVLTYGARGDVSGAVVSIDEELHATIDVVTPWGPMSGVRLGVRGAHQLGNALAAVAVAGTLGVSLDDIATGLTNVTGPAARMQLFRTASGALILDDSYNANPASMEAGLRALQTLPAERHIAVLGEMAELGATSDEEHRAIAALAAELGVDVLAVSTDAYGLPNIDGVDAVVERLGDLSASDAVLVKGSRKAQLDQLIARLRPAR